ncbi:MAG: exodeoxyribonuclease VII large subunit [Polyangiaceae bacterium]
MSKKPEPQISLPFGVPVPVAPRPRPEVATPGHPPAAAVPPSPAPPARRAEPKPPVEVPAPEVLSVARLDRLIKRVLEGATADVRVQGEISGLHPASSGHLYFSLKDEREDATIDCVMYRSAPARARRQLRDGERVVLAGRATLYSARGRLQFIAEDLLQSARGALLEAKEARKRKLAAEGLFDPAKKRPLPKDPHRIGVLTSRQGAAVHDVIRVAHRRGGVALLLVPTPVQGQGAATRIAGAIHLADRLGLDALIVTRGGGSAEDLAAYDEEVVVRAIAAARTPIVSAVGHEIDVSLADLAADARAATPSQAAELLIPDERERRSRLAHLHKRLQRAVLHHIGDRSRDLIRLQRRMGDPRNPIHERAQIFDDLSLRLERSLRRRLASERQAQHSLRRRLEAQHPRRVLASARRAIDAAAPRLHAALTARLHRERAQLERDVPKLATAVHDTLEIRRRELGAAAARLDALSPLSVLARGYAIAVTETGRALRSAAEVRAGDRLRLRLHEGEVQARVEPTEDDES